MSKVIVIKSVNHQILEQWKKHILHDKDFKEHDLIYEPNISHPVWALIQKVFRVLFVSNVIYDVFWIHYLSKQSIVLLIFLKIFKRRNKKFITLWGSDLLKMDKLMVFMLKYLHHGIIFTVPTEYMRNRLVSEIPTADIRIVKFGLDTIDNIDKVRYGDSENILSKFAKKYNLDSNKVIIAIGTNSSKNQQTIDVIQILNECSVNLSNFMFVFHLSYGDASYATEIESQLANSKLNYRIIYDFLLGEDLACLRMISNLLVQVQKVDAFSGAMQEVLYSGNRVITGNWLDYKEICGRLDGLYFVDKLSDIPSQLLNIYHSPREKCNGDLIKELSSWSSVQNTWMDLLNET